MKWEYKSCNHHELEELGLYEWECYGVIAADPNDEYAQTAYFLKRPVPTEIPYRWTAEGYEPRNLANQMSRECRGCGALLKDDSSHRCLGPKGGRNGTR